MRQPLGGRDMDPAMISPHAHGRLILMNERSLVQARFELVLDGPQVFMAHFDEAGDAACRELDALPEV